MNLAKVTGRVWATKKDPGLEGKRLYFIQPLSFSNLPTGDPIVAIDTVDSGTGDLILYVSSYEATIPFQPQLVPVDATIVAVVDRVDLVEGE